MRSRSEERKKVLGVVNYEPISAYVKTGVSPKQMEEYYNPKNYFDSVHIFACKDTEWDISAKVHVHPLSSGFKASIQLVKYCLQYNVCILRNFEAFHTHLLTSEVKRVLKIPAVISLHDVLYPPTILAYDHICTYVEWLKEAIIKKYGYYNVTLLLNRIDENLFRPGTFHRVPKEFYRYSNRIVSIGRLNDKYKNLSTLIKAIVNVVEKYPETLLVIIGEGDDRQKHEKLIVKLGLSHNVRIIGNQSQEMVVEYLNWSDFHALCNPYGDLGKPFAESLMVGKPVIATGGKGNAKYHLIDGFNSKMVHYQDIYKPEAIASAILYMIQNKNVFDSKAMRERAIKEYGFAFLSNLEASIYDNLLNKYRVRSSSEIFSHAHGQKNTNLITFNNLKTLLKKILLYFYTQYMKLYFKFKITFSL